MVGVANKQRRIKERARTSGTAADTVHNTYPTQRSKYGRVNKWMHFSRLYG